MSRLAADLSALVEDELRAFNLERVYAGEKGVTPASIAESARTFPMMANRRVVVVLRAEKILKPKRRGKGEGDETNEEDEPSGDVDVLEAYVKQPEPSTTLVFVAADVDRTRRLYKAIQKQATIVECWGLRSGKDPRVDLRQVARTAEALVRQRLPTRPADRSARGPARRGACRTDIATLRGDLDRLLLYAAGNED